MPTHIRKCETHVGSARLTSKRVSRFGAPARDYQGRQAAFTNARLKKFRAFCGFSSIAALKSRSAPKAGKVLAESLVPTPLPSVRKNYPGTPVVILADEVPSGVVAKSRHWVCVLIATSSIGASALAGGYQQGYLRKRLQAIRY
jgi:hypothetical protein